MKDIPAGGVEAEVLRRPDGSVRLHDAFSNQIVAYVDAKGEAGLLSGGESSVVVRITFLRVMHLCMADR